MLLYYIPVVLAVVYYALYFYFRRTFNYWKKRNVAGPKPITFFGNVKEFTLRRSHYGIVFKGLYDSFPKEKVVGIYRMTTPSLLIRDLDIIKHIMIKDFDLFRDRGLEFSKKGLGQNLFHSDGSTWSALRARFSPIFTSGKLKGMYHLVNDCANNMMNYLKNIAPEGKELDINTLAQKYTMSSISVCAFGVPLNRFECEVDETLQNLDKILLKPNYGFEIDMLYPGILKKLGISLFPARGTKFFQDLVRDITLQRNSKPSGRGDLMDLMLQLRQTGSVSTLRPKEGEDIDITKITDDIIASQAFVFYLGGYETSSTTISFLLYQLARNPEIQDKLREEIDSVTQAHGLAQSEVTFDSLKDMKYLDMVVSETLRMYPIVDPLQRKAERDYKIPGTDVIIEKGMLAIISLLGIHYDEKYYPNPDVFDPERFDPKVAGSRHPCAYLPFGVGPRNCIGMRFGSLQTRLCIAKLISKFQVEPSENTKAFTFSPEKISLTPLENIYLNIKPRAS